jgi:hypothetical protein
MHSLKKNRIINNNISSKKFNKTTCHNRSVDKSNKSLEKDDLYAISYLKKNRYLNIDNDNFYIPNRRSYDISRNYNNTNKLFTIKSDDNYQKICNIMQKKPVIGLKKYIIDTQRKMFEYTTENIPNLTTRNESKNSYNEYLKQKKNLLYLNSSDYIIIKNKMKEDLKIKNKLNSLNIRPNYKEKNKVIKINDRNNKFKINETKKKYNTINNILESTYGQYNNNIQTIDIDRSKDIFNYFGINI